MTKTVQRAGIFLVLLVFFWLLHGIQERRKKELSDRLASIEKQAGVMETRSATEGGGSSQQGRPNTVAGVVDQYLAKSREPFDLKAMIKEVEVAARSMNFARVIHYMVTLSLLSEDELGALADEYFAMEVSEATRLFMDGLFEEYWQSGGGPAEKLSRKLKMPNGQSIWQAAEQMKRWATEDFAAAESWYEEALEAGDLDPTGTNMDPRDFLYRGLLEGLAASSPRLAMQKLKELSPERQQRNVSAVATAMIQNGHRDEIKGLLDIGDQWTRSMTLQSIGSIDAHNSSPDETVAWAQTLDLSLEDSRKLIGGVMNSSGVADRKTIGEKVEWAGAADPEGDASHYAVAILSRHVLGDREELDTWLTEQPAGEMKDTFLSTAASQLWHRPTDFEAAVGYILDVSDEGHRTRKLREIYNNVQGDDDKMGILNSAVEGRGFSIEEIQQQEEGE